MKYFQYLLTCALCFLFVSCLDSGYDLSKITGRYKMQINTNSKNQNEGGFLNQVFTRVMNATELEVSFDGRGNGINHFGNDVVGFGARILNYNIDSDNIYDQKFKYKLVDGNKIYVKFSGEKEFVQYAELLSVSDDYNYIKMLSLFGNNKGEYLRLVKMSN